MPEIRYPFRNFRFKVEFDGVESAGFSEVSGEDVSVDVVEYREGNEIRTTPRKLSGLTKYGNITLKWGVIGTMEMMEWLHTVASDNTAGPTGIARKNLVIKMLDDTGADGPSWEIINAWPMHYTGPTFNGLGSEIAIDTLELTHEGMNRIDGGAVDSAAPSTV
ncbi:MAG: phage tail protein [Desulfosporosinus sp. BRH_c37]|nr:MAG: phage tail protein [Desulfosporosinus sp. BRH_c37]